jgi:hypothetical protein
MQVRHRLPPLRFLGFSFGSLFSRESDARPKGCIVVSPMRLECGSEVGLALCVRYMTAMGFVSGGLEHQEQSGSFVKSKN